VVLSAEIDRETILRCLDLGAAGYIPKTYHADVITHALRLIASGHVYVPREAIDPRRDANEPIRLRSAGSDPRGLGLTDRQCDVLRLILRGLPNKLICRQLDLAEGTVKVHVSAVLRALGVRNRTQAVIAASRLGLRMID
jgi:DNA-binding NarL/FixJ family response regulator